MPLVQATGKTPEFNILLNSSVKCPASILHASIKYSFKSLSTPGDLFFLIYEIAHFIIGNMVIKIAKNIM